MIKVIINIINPEIDQEQPKRQVVAWPNHLSELEPRRISQPDKRPMLQLDWKHFIHGCRPKIALVTSEITSRAIRCIWTVEEEAAPTSEIKG